MQNKQPVRPKCYQCGAYVRESNDYCMAEITFDDRTGVGLIWCDDSCMQRTLGYWEVEQRTHKRELDDPLTPAMVRGDYYPIDLIRGIKGGTYVLT